MIVPEACGCEVCEAFAACFDAHLRAIRHGADTSATRAMLALASAMLNRERGHALTPEALKSRVDAELAKGRN